MKKNNENNRYREEELEEKELNSSSENEESVNTKDTNDNESVEDLKKQIEELKNEVLKCKANEINFKKYLEEDKMRSIKFANQGLLEKFVDQIDLFDSVVNMKTDDPMLKNFLIFLLQVKIFMTQFSL